MINAYFKTYPGVQAIILTGSLARGKAVEGSCVDLFIFVGERQFENLVTSLRERARAYSSLGGRICFYEGELEGGILFGDVRVDICFTDGKLDPRSENPFDITRDEFETTIGNLFVYSVMLYEKGDHYQKLKQKYLPYYNDELREIRLVGTSEEFAYKIWKTKWLAERNEYLSSFEALLEAQRIFLQHLFIKKGRYPIDYSKWIGEQCSRILQMPGLYQEIASIINGIELTEKTLTKKADALEKLFVQYR